MSSLVGARAPTSHWGEGNAVLFRRKKPCETLPAMQTVQRKNTGLTGNDLTSMMGRVFLMAPELWLRRTLYERMPRICAEDAGDPCHETSGAFLWN